jgi:hypothetical protein
MNLFGCSEQPSQKESIEVGNLKNTYHSSDIIEFTISNSFSDTIFYYIGVESFFENRWVETILDINRPFSKSARISKISNGETSNISFQFTDIPDGYFDRFKQFRFVVNYGMNVTDINQKKHSDTFEMTTD